MADCSPPPLSRVCCGTQARTGRGGGVPPRMLAHRAHRGWRRGGEFGNATLAREDARGVWLCGGSTASDRTSLCVSGAGASRASRCSRSPHGGHRSQQSASSPCSTHSMQPWPVRDPGRVVRLSNNSTSIDLRIADRRCPGRLLAEPSSIYFGAARDGRISGAVTIRDERSVGPKWATPPRKASWVGGSYFTGAGHRHGRWAGGSRRRDRRRHAGSRRGVESRFLATAVRRRSRRLPGGAVRLDDVPFTVVGVAGHRRSWGRPPDRVDIWMPVASAALLRPEDSWVRAVGPATGHCSADGRAARTGVHA